MTIHFVDLRAQYATIRDEVADAIQAVLDSCAFSGGPFVESFEARFAAAHGAAHCAAVNSGTAALHVAMMALGLGSGDEVIVPTNTFFATAEAVSLCGATPVFVDCDELSFNIDPALAERAITPRTKAIVAVHLYGQPANMAALREVTRRHNLYLIEDAAQAHLAEFDGHAVGTFGDVACFSFYPGKNLGAYGEGGAVLTNDRALHETVCALRNHGSTIKYQHTHVGHNYRMAGFQGAILSVKLGHLAAWTELRRQHARRYSERLAQLPQVQVPREIPGAKHVYHLYVIRAQNRDGLQAYLQEQKIYTGIHYPIPCHLQPAYADLPYARGDFPIAERVADEIVSLPMYAELTDGAIERVCSQIEAFYRV